MKGNTLQIISVFFISSKNSNNILDMFLLNSHVLLDGNSSFMI